MQIKIEKPPIWDEAHARFEIDDRWTIYTYGDVIYNPSNIYVDEYLIAHESTHGKQQGSMPGGAGEWWQRYFDEPEFRLSQEVEAYQNQYKAFCDKIKSRERRFAYRWELSGFLSSPMYQCAIDRNQAAIAIKGNTHK